MATGNPATPAADQAQSASLPQNTETPQALKSWWNGFKKRTGGKKEAQVAPEPPPQGIFGVPLEESIKYANVAISLMDENGKSFIYGYVPIVVAKCGVFLKEKATDVEGIFRLSGSAKRIKELQAAFDSPTRYGKGLDWTGYTVHDAANVLRRYLNQLPQPIVPLNCYEQFREPLRGHQSMAVNDGDAQPVDMGNFDHDKAIERFQQLIKELPPLNRQLLLYILDLLSVFASKSDLNRMTSANLAAIFQPGMLSHPQHDMAPQEYRLSQDVIIFLIDNQDSFLIGMNGTAADEKTVREVQSGSKPQQPTSPTKAALTGLGRSASNASGGADRLAGIRRNLSVSSKNSKQSSVANTPNTPSSGVFGAAQSSSGVYRSNTVPSKRSPALSSTRRGRGLDSPTTPVALGSPSLAPPARSASPTTPGSRLSQNPVTSDSNVGPTPFTPVSQTMGVEQPSIGVTPAPETPTQEESKENLGANSVSPSARSQGDGNLPVDASPSKASKFSGLLTKSPTGEFKDGRQPKKLQKRRGPSSMQVSASSSTNSLQNADESARAVLTNNSQGAENTSKKELAPNSATTASAAPRVGEGLEESMGTTVLESSQKPSDSTLKPKSPSGSVHSKSSVTDMSEHDHGAEGNGSKPEKEKKKRWRFSSAAKHNPSASVTSPRLLGTNGGAGISASSVGSGQKARKSLSNEIPPASLDNVQSTPTQQSSISDNSQNKDKEVQEEVVGEKKGLFGRFRAKVAQSKDERREREAEKERAKSPPRGNTEHGGSQPNISGIAQNVQDPSRGRSIDATVEQQAQGSANVPPAEPNTTAS